MTSDEMMTLASRVVERALQISGYMPASPEDPTVVRGPGELFVDNLAGKLIEMVSRADLKAIPALKALSSPDAARTFARNERLALALGACSCFGEDASCSQCGGGGKPGSKLPNRPQFEALVRPALQRVAHLRLAARDGQRHSLQS
jgi:hypothetical protein